MATDGSFFSEKIKEINVIGYSRNILGSRLSHSFSFDCSDLHNKDFSVHYYETLWHKFSILNTHKLKKSG